MCMEVVGISLHSSFNLRFCRNGILKNWRRPRYMTAATMQIIKSSGKHACCHHSTLKQAAGYESLWDSLALGTVQLVQQVP